MVHSANRVSNPLINSLSIHVTASARTPRKNVSLTYRSCLHHLPSCPITPLLHAPLRRLELLLAPPTEALHAVELLVQIAPLTSVETLAAVVARSAVMPARVHEGDFGTHRACWTGLAWVCGGCEWSLMGLIEDGGLKDYFWLLYIPGLVPLFAVDVSVFELCVGWTRLRLLLRVLGSAVMDCTFCTVGRPS